MKALAGFGVLLCSTSVFAEFPETLDATFVVSDSEEIQIEMHNDNIEPYVQFIPGAIFGSPMYPYTH